MGKQRKTASELRELILDGARKNPVCPKGMEVAIRPMADRWKREHGEMRKKSGCWTVDCIPPRDHHIAYADCCALLTRLTAEMNSQFELAPS